MTRTTESLHLPAPARGDLPAAAADPRAVVQGERWRVTVLTDGLLRLEYADDGRFEDRPSTFARHRALPVPEFRVVERGDVVEVVTARLRLTYDRRPFSTAGLSVAVGGGLSAYHSVWRYGEPADGLGGTARTLDQADGAVPLEGGVVSRQGYAVLDDSRSMVFEDDGWVEPRDGTREDLYVFGYGHDYPAALHAFHAVSGPAPLLPRWALGNWWSRFHRYTADGYRAVVDRFAAERIPLSVSVLDMDWHVTDVDPALGSGWTGYSWNRDLFPDPPALLRRLHDQGLRVTLNVHPADGVRAHEDAYAAMCAALGREPDGDPVAFDVTDREFLAAYFSVLHRGLEADGVDFWWVDWQSGPHSRVPGIDPLWMLNHFHYLDNAHDGRRPLTFSRYAGPGSHRYPVGFSGDAVISWDSLDFQPEFTATAANIGYGWWSHDIGGHMHGYRDEELATRWVQLGVFSPVLRLHSSDNPFTSKEPWSFGVHAQAVQTRFLRLRHRLVPYLHTMNHRSASEATALVRPLYHQWPEHDEAYDARHQYLFGSELLVAALTSPSDPVTRATAVRAWLPPGTWTDLLSGAVYDGDRLLDLHRGLDTLPVLARTGAVVPLDGAEVPANDPENPRHLEVLVVPGDDGAFTLVEDDGTGDGTDPARIARTRLGWADATGTFTVDPVAGAAGCVPAERDWTLTLVSTAIDDALAGSVRATVDGAEVPVAVRGPGDGTASARCEGAGADAVLGGGADAVRSADPVRGAGDVRSTSAAHGGVGADGRLRVTVTGVPVGARLRIVTGPVALAGPAVADEVLRVLTAAWADHDLSTRALRVATSDHPLHVRLAHLEALELPASLVSALREVLLARG